MDGAQVLTFLQQRGIKHVSISEKPWSSWTEADYTLEQWDRACLIHFHETTPPTSKNMCKLPVRTPDGVLNRNGVHAAAAALAGARNPVKAPQQKIDAAKKALIGLYKQLNEDPPPSLTHDDVALEFLEHHGVKGQKWGVRHTPKPSRHTSSDAKRVAALRKRKSHELTNKQLKLLNERMNLEKNFRKLNPGPIAKGIALATAILGGVELGVRAFNIYNGPAGKAAIEAGKKAIKA